MMPQKEKNRKELVYALSYCLYQTEGFSSKAPFIQDTEGPQIRQPERKQVYSSFDFDYDYDCGFVDHPTTLLE